LLRGRTGAEGTYVYRSSDQDCPGSLPITVRVRVDGPTSVSKARAQAWCESQTLAELVVAGVDEAGEEVWSTASDAAQPGENGGTWFAAPGGLPNLLANHLESCFHVAAAEDVDAVILLPGDNAQRLKDRDLARQAHVHPLRTFGIFRSDAFAWHAGRDEIVPTKDQRLVKVVSPSWETGSPVANRFRRGPYAATSAMPWPLVIPVRDASRVARAQPPGAKPAILVTAPFLARGGAEQTLHATMSALAGRYDFSIATLAPHRAALGDRRDDFRGITEKIYCLGDLVHPDVMVGLLESILDATGAEVLYNANGTTLFYDFAPRLKTSRPNLRVVDHLYDHEVGYIEWYDRELLGTVDVCIAENHEISRTLIEKRGWPERRAPVIWPCGRAAGELPDPGRRDEIRDHLRRELGIQDDAVLFLTAARMHPQKRLFDLVELAARVRDLEHLHFLLVGGGELEDQIDEAIATGPAANIRRLAFRSDIPELILASDVGCLVSEFEGLPVFMLECLQLGRPFLGTRVGDLGRVLDETGAGEVVSRPGDLAGLEAAVRRLADADHRARLSRSALRAAPRFSVESCAASYAAVFEMGRKGRGP
jgi:glycosyltransferase involved in cell wall biosynthesis